MHKLLFLSLLAMVPAEAGVVLFDDFESGIIDPAKWLVPGHAQVVTDPLNPNNKVLSFFELNKGGDIFSVPLNLDSAYVTLSFDYLGFPVGANVGTDTGGFIIVDVPNSFSGWVLLGTSSNGFPALPDMLNLTPRVWHHIEVTFPSSLVQAGDGSKITFEQWATSPNAVGNAFFDNIVVTTTPEPRSWVMAGVGLAGMLARRLLS